MLEIENIGANENRVIRAFTMMGIHDKGCTIRGLINILNDIREFTPLKDIMGTAVPLIFLRSPKPGDVVRSGENIEFEIRTISEAQIKWRKYSNGKVEIVKDHVVVLKGSQTIVSYEIKESDHGWFSIYVECKRDIHAISQMVYVGPSDVNISAPNIIPPVVELCQDDIKRVALLFGITNYGDEKRNLQAPETDIYNLEGVLLSLGFSVYCFGELNLAQLKHILSKFAHFCIEEDSYVLFYYAGHGMNKNKVDYMELSDKKMVSVLSVLDVLLKSKPKVLISIFDMCRNDSNEQPILPIITQASHKNLMLVMSTLPLKESFERSEKFETSSLIIEPLCQCFSLLASKHPISMVLTKFVTICENIEQKPTIFYEARTEIIGKNSVIQRMEVECEWIEKPENPEIVNCVVVNFKSFHNILSVLICRRAHTTIEFVDIRSRDQGRWVTTKVTGGIRSTINLFHLGHILGNKSEIFIEIKVREGQQNDKYHKIKIIFPKSIIDIIRT